MVSRRSLIGRALGLAGGAALLPAASREVKAAEPVGDFQEVTNTTIPLLRRTGETDIPLHPYGVDTYINDEEQCKAIFRDPGDAAPDWGTITLSAIYDPVIVLVDTTPDGAPLRAYRGDRWKHTLDESDFHYPVPTGDTVFAETEFFTSPQGRESDNSRVWIGVEDVWYRGRHLISGRLYEFSLMSNGTLEPAWSHNPSIMSQIIRDKSVWMEYTHKHSGEVIRIELPELKSVVWK